MTGLVNSPWKKILVFGTNGQLATALRPMLPVGTVFRGQNETDFCESSQVLKALEDVRPDLVVNTAAYTQVDLAQSHVDTCTKVNATAVGLIAKWCAENKCFLIHISTDYVFDGRQSAPYKETDETNPLNIYGSSKLLAEHLIQATEVKHLILRTSWLYNEVGANFVKSMLKYAREKDEIRIVDDQIGSPTYAGDFARELAKILKNTDLKTGLYHVANKGFCSRFELISETLKKAFPFDSSLKAKISVSKTKDFPTPAQRPMCTKLDTSKAERELGLTLPPWQEGLETFIRRLYQ